MPGNKLKKKHTDFHEENYGRVTEVDKETWVNDHLPVIKGVNLKRKCWFFLLWLIGLMQLIQ